MKYLKLFEGFNKEGIDSICKEYGIENYTINSDGSIDVVGDVNLSDKRLTKLPLKFRSVTGNFYCHNNQLTSLEGCPESVGGSFWCRYNHLKSLEGCPESVGCNFWCSENDLTSLEGSPKSVGGGFSCSNNGLTSLEGGPESVGGNFNYYNNPCYLIYSDWINDRDKRDMLLDLMEDYDFLRDDVIIWDILEAFYKDGGLPVPDREELEKYYKIED